ncbi:MAG: DUF4783 domain-containing protein [Bacteroidetes bacterium]|nr:DUF4783 domain-containing protein [Rhodothermia bacterium]MCS7155010.1 DUF4783 domain-containing protein [Bacteroidota bacterium]MCX7907294.1 DUF4783 domain-containing protein [Bacteroidota bacterium]MDW8137979.1 DUF4783 domain-containing protein [Bacteroidota bacterium]MDW8286169.1 DUF4783 domain-containing protein [Bacteroidota bacterium]
MGRKLRILGLMLWAGFAPLWAQTGGPPREPAEGPFAQIQSALSSGAVRALVTLVKEGVEIAVLEERDLYSRRQAEYVLGAFFQRFPPAGFQFRHRGGADGSSYGIGVYTYRGPDGRRGQLRVYVLLRMGERGWEIEELRFET